METLTEQLHSPELCEEDQNGSVMMDDLDHIQKVNRELEQQLSDKNRVRQLNVSSQLLPNVCYVFETQTLYHSNLLTDRWTRSS